MVDDEKREPIVVLAFLGKPSLLKLNVAYLDVIIIARTTASQHDHASFAADDRKSP